MNKILVLIIYFGGGVFATLSAQNTQGTISGQIQDSQGVLEGATVFLMKDRKKQELVKFTQSDKEGRFSITVPAGDYLLGVSFVGYQLHGQEVHIPANDIDVGRITLQESIQELQTVLVQGKAILVKTQPDGFVVNVRDLREQANDALDLLKLMPRVQVKGEQLKVIGKEKVLVKIGNVLQV